MQRAARLEAIAVSGDTAHGVEAYRAALHGFVGFAAEISPLLIQLKSLVKGTRGQALPQWF